MRFAVRKFEGSEFMLSDSSTIFRDANIKQLLLVSLNGKRTEDIRRRDFNVVFKSEQETGSGFLHFIC